MTNKDLLELIKFRIDTRLNNVLVDMRPNYDDSITGFNEAWDIVSAILKQEIEHQDGDTRAQSEERG